MTELGEMMTSYQYYPYYVLDEVMEGQLGDLVVVRLQYQIDMILHHFLYLIHITQVSLRW